MKISLIKKNLKLGTIYNLIIAHVDIYIFDHIQIYNNVEIYVRYLNIILSESGADDEIGSTSYYNSTGGPYICLFLLYVNNFF